MNQPKETKNIYIELQSMDKTDIILWFHAPCKNEMYSEMPTVREHETYMNKECIEKDH